MGNVLHLELIWGTRIYFAFLRWHQCSSLVVTVFLGILFSSIRKSRFLTSLIGNTELLSTKCRGIRPNLAARGKSHEFSRVAAGTWNIFSSRRGWPFETWVCSAKSGHRSSYDGHLGKLNYAWQENTDPSGGEPVGHAFLISWHSYIGIPINFHEVSGIVTFWSTELSTPLEVSNGCEGLCPEDVENYGFF